jgi:hypothetical protein
MPTCSARDPKQFKTDFLVRESVENVISGTGVLRCHRRLDPRFSFEQQVVRSFHEKRVHRLSPFWNGSHQTRTETDAPAEHTTKASEQRSNYPNYDEMAFFALLEIAQMRQVRQRRGYTPGRAIRIRILRDRSACTRSCWSLG